MHWRATAVGKRRELNLRQWRVCPRLDPLVIDRIGSRDLCRKSTRHTYINIGKSGTARFFLPRDSIVEGADYNIISG